MSGRERDQFCSLCDVSLDLHNGPNSCDLADRKAHLLQGVLR